MKDEIAKLLAERYFKITDINDWAIKCLEKGYDSKSLRILASMSQCDSDSELDNYFQRSLTELGWDQVQRREYLMKYAKILAGEIVGEKADPIKASRKIYQILADLDYPAELHGWFEIDEMIWGYEYFAEAGEISYFYRPQDELVSIIRQASEELINSKENI